ncbi:MAG: dihydrofolate reductase family protein [Ornithinimicrobium sp.]
MTSHSWQGRVFIGCSLDGFIARPDGDLGWLTDPPRDDGHASGHDGPAPPPGYEDFMAGIDHLVMGRGTYEKVLTFGQWPYNAQHVIVLGSTMRPGTDERITVARSVDEVLQTLEGRGARGVYVDGGRVIQEFLRRGLVDEMVISTAPVLIGAGIRLFGDLAVDVRLTHLGTSYGDSGMTSSRYRVTR